MSQAMQLEKAQKEAPEDTATQRKLATFYDDYAKAGLIDSPSQDAFRHKAIALYEKQLTQQDEADTRLRLARLYLHQREAGKAHAVLGRAMESGRLIRLAIVLWYMEALSGMTALARLRFIARCHARAMESLTGIPVFPADTGGILRAWSMAPNHPV